MRGRSQAGRTRRLAALSLALGLVGAGVGAEQISEKDQRRIEKAREAIDAGRYSKAVVALRNARGREMPCVECLTTLAEAYHAMQHYDRAADSLREAIAAFPDAERPFELYNELGHALFNLAFLPSIDEYRKLVRQRADRMNENAWDERRIAVLDEAVEVFTTAIELGGDRANAVYVNLAQTLYRQGQFEAAGRALDEHAGGGPAGPTAEELAKCLKLRPDLPRLKPEGTYDVDGASVEPPRQLSIVHPTYNDPTRKAKVQGTVIIEAMIDKEGVVRCPRLVKSVPLLDLEAYSAVRQWSFEPARLDGAPVEVLYNLSIGFGVRLKPQ